MQAGQVASWGATAGNETSQILAPGSTPVYRIGVLPLPKLTEGAGLSHPIVSRGFYISSSSSSHEACWILGKYLSGIPNVINGVPACTNVNSSLEWENKVTPITAKTYRAAMKNFRERNLNSIHPTLIAPLDIWWNGVLYGVIKGRSPEQLLQTAQNYADSYVACLSTANLNPQEKNLFQEQINACAIQADPNWQ